MSQPVVQLPKVSCYKTWGQLAPISEGFLGSGGSDRKGQDRGYGEGEIHGGGDWPGETRAAAVVG